MGGKSFNFQHLHLAVHLFLTVICCVFSLSEIRQHSTMYESLEVVDFKDYSRVQLLRFQIPEETIEAVWSFYTLTSREDCAVKTVSVELQAESYPLVTPNNETYPERFYLHRTERHVLKMSSMNHSEYLSLVHPLPGDWYAAFFTTAIHDRIFQKGLSEECEYFIQPYLYTEIHPTVTSMERRDGKLSVKSRHTHYIRFFLEEAAWKYMVMVATCGNVNEALFSAYDCHLVMKSRNSALPSASVWQAEKTCLSNHTEDCILTVVSPDMGTWQYLAFTNLGSEDITLSYSVDSTVCTRHPDKELMTRLQSNLSSSQCVIMPDLDRFQGFADFSSQFGVMALNQIITPQLQLYGQLTAVIPLTMNRVGDHIGSTLKVQLTAVALGLHIVDRVVVGCFHKGQIGYTEDKAEGCNEQDEGHFQLKLYKSGNAQENLYVPYPEAGNWYLTLTMLCYTDLSLRNRTFCGNETALVDLDISTAACVEGGCENSGNCYTYTRGSSRFSTCSCLAGWRGYGCTDGTEASSYSAQLEEALLLTLSNLMFIPAILVAIYRNFYAEALVYFCTMFFSSFYHACDGDRVLTYCMSRYDILSACDFFGSVLAFWVTLVAMLKVKEPLNPTLLLLGVVGLVYGTLADKHSLWLYVAPAISGFTLILISWGLKCHQRQGLYPSRRRYIFCLLPGGLFALLGICLFAFVETDVNYKYVHSVWHVTMAISIVFVLPPSPPWKRMKKIRICDNDDDDDDECIHVISTPDDVLPQNGGIVNLSMTHVP